MLGAPAPGRPLGVFADDMLAKSEEGFPNEAQSPSVLMSGRPMRSWEEEAAEEDAQDTRPASRLPWARHRQGSMAT